MRTIFKKTFIFLLFAGYYDHLEASSYIEQQKLIGSNITNFSEFGHASDIDGDWMALGAYKADSGAGAVYMYERQGLVWVESQKLTALDSGAGDNFGVALDLEGNRLLVGAPMHDNSNGTNAGAAYYFSYDGSNWTQEQQITTALSQSNGGFGATVSLSGNRAAINVPNVSRSGNGFLVTYQFNGEQWSFQQQINSPSTAPPSEINTWRFARQFEMENDLIIVSDFREDDSGAAYIYGFDMGSWQLLQRIAALDGNMGDRFGSWVSLENNTAAIGAGGVNFEAGAVYLFSNENSLLWTEIIKLTASDSNSGGQFGQTGVVLRDNSLIVGAISNFNDNVETGALYLYEKNQLGWHETQKLVSSDGQFDDQFGISAAINDTYIAVGARFDDDSGTNTGAGYIFLKDLIFDNGFE